MIRWKRTRFSGQASMPAVLWTAGSGGEGSCVPGQASTEPFASISETDICSDAHGRLVVFVRRLPWLPVQTFYSQELAKRYVDAPATARCRAGSVGLPGLSGAGQGNRGRPTMALSDFRRLVRFQGFKGGEEIDPERLQHPRNFYQDSKKAMVFVSSQVWMYGQRSRWGSIS